MKAIVISLGALLAGSVGGLGYGYMHYVDLKKNCGEVRTALGESQAARNALEKKCRDTMMALNESQTACNALAQRVAVLEKELRVMRDSSDRNKFAPMIEAIKTAKTIATAKKCAFEATTSLLREKNNESYRKVVEVLKGRRVIFTGTVKDIGKRIISFSQMFLTLNVAEGFDVKYIFEKDSENDLLAIQAGQTITLGGYVISTGDLSHQLTLGGPQKIDAGEYATAERFTLGK